MVKSRISIYPLCFIVEEQKTNTIFPHSPQLTTFRRSENKLNITIIFPIKIGFSLKDLVHREEIRLHRYYIFFSKSPAKIYIY